MRRIEYSLSGGMVCKHWDTNRFNKTLHEHAIIGGMDIDELLGIRQFKGLRIEKQGTEVLVFGELVDTEKTCPDCGKGDIKGHQYYQKKVRHLSLFNQPTYLSFTHTLYRCLSCQRLFMERLGFCGMHRPYTLAYEDRIYELCRAQDMKRVGDLEGLSWAQVAGILKKGGATERAEAIGTRRRKQPVAPL